MVLARGGGGIYNSFTLEATFSGTIIDKCGTLSLSPWTLRSDSVVLARGWGGGASTSSLFSGTIIDKWVLLGHSVQTVWVLLVFFVWMEIVEWCWVEGARGVVTSTTALLWKPASAGPS